MNKSLRYGTIAAAAAACLALTPGLALAVGQQTSPTVSQEVQSNMGSGDAGTLNDNSKQTNLGQPGTAGALQTQAGGQSAGVTSGPAAGSNVAPGTAVAKQDKMGQQSTSGGTHMSGKAAAGVGAPGPGTEAGKAPQTKSAQE
jgi:hypothetical protein